MSIYELIQELAYYPADAEVFAIIGNNTKLDIDGVRPEFRGSAITVTSVVLEVK